RTWPFEIANPGQSRGVVTVHPVPQGLTVHAAGFGRRFAVHAIEHQRKRKYPTRRPTILLPARRLAKLRSRQIKSGNRYRRSHRCRSPQKPASSQSFTDLGIPNESQFRAVGIIPIEVRPDISAFLSAGFADEPSFLIGEAAVIEPLSASS